MIKMATSRKHPQRISFLIILQADRTRRIVREIAIRIWVFLHLTVLGEAIEFESVIIEAGFCYSDLHGAFYCAAEEKAVGINRNIEHAGNIVEELGKAKITNTYG